MKIQVKVEGAKAFKINSLQLRMSTLRTDFDFMIPSLHGHGRREHFGFLTLRGVV